jgi:hypothetical protein
MTHRTPQARRLLTAGAVWAATALPATALPLAQDAAQELAEAEEVDEWALLDQELQALESLHYTYEPSAEIWGYGRVNLFHRKEGDNAGVNLDNIRLNLTGAVGRTSYRVTTDLGPGNLNLQDAWLSVPMGDELAFTLGQFKIPFLRSGLVEARDLLFIARTRNGIYYSRRDQGVMVNGDHGRFHWAIAGQNGADSLTERILTTANVRLNVIGPEELPWEGAYGARSLTRLTCGAGVSNDDAARNGTAFALDANLVHRRFSLQGEWLDYGEAYNLVDALEQRGGTSPWSITTSFMLVPDKYELALRYDDFDDVSRPLDYHRRTFTLGVNRYIQGHDLKWQLNYVAAHKGGSSALDDGPNDAIVALGLTASF